MKGSKKSSNDQELIKWDQWTNLAIQIALVLITVFSFCETQKSTKSAQASTKVAQDALALQQKQYEDSKEQEKSKSIEDAEIRKSDVEMTNQQIEALKEQVKAIKTGVKNTEVTQSPQLDIVNFGFHFVENNKLVWYYEVKNYGVRPAKLKKITMEIFDKNYKK